MAKRKKISKKSSKKMFSKGASKIHGKNALGTSVLRGGIRL